ncbi:MAG: hypothetical protein IJ740_06030 [Ruminococcus sp.]|nr:hypothetical protein [Ruminococcus sp.]
MAEKKKGLGCAGIICLFVIVGIFGALTRGHNNKDRSETEITSVSQGDTKGASKKKAVPANSQEGSAESRETTEDVDGTSDHIDENSVIPTIDDQVLWEVDGVKISATGIDTDSFWGAELKLLVENNSDKDIGISTNAVIVNDYMINDITSITVTAGNKTNDKVTLFSSSLNAAGIENIGKIELYLHTFDPNTYETLNSSECITIETSDFDKTDTESNIEGAVLLDSDGIKVTAQYVDENSFWGAAAILYIENNTDRIVSVECEDTAINGFMVNGFQYVEVYPHKKAIDEITFFSSDLEENGITEIEEIETTVIVIDGDSYEEIANSGKVKFAT